MGASTTIPHIHISAEFLYEDADCFGVAIIRSKVQRNASKTVLCIHISAELLNEDADGFSVATSRGTVESGT